MTNQTARVVLSLSLIIGTVGLYILIFVILQGLFSGEVEALALSGMISSIILSVGWILLWRKEIVWTNERRTRTFNTIAISFTISAIGGMLSLLVRRYDEIGMLMAAMVYFVLFCSGTALAWRETPSERVRRISQIKTIHLTCLKCGYDLTGLREARCPECGTLYTLDELFISALDRLNGEPNYLDD